MVSRTKRDKKNGHGKIYYNGYLFPNWKKLNTCDFPVREGIKINKNEYGKLLRSNIDSRTGKKIIQMRNPIHKSRRF